MTDEERLYAFIEALESAKEGSAVKFFNNCRDTSRTQELLYAGKSYRFVLDRSFYWDETPEGFVYWSSVCTTLRAPYAHP